MVIAIKLKIEIALKKIWTVDYTEYIIKNAFEWEKYTKTSLLCFMELAEPLNII